MRYPKPLRAAGTVGVCAPSSGYGEGLQNRFDKAVANVRGLGFDVLVSGHVAGNTKCVSAPAKVRAEEFTALYENPAVSAIIPPWGGEFLMDMLPYLDIEKLAQLPPKWVCGYSDISTLTFALTLMCDNATIHGSNFMNMGYRRIHESDLVLFQAMAEPELVQHSWPYWGGYTSWDGVENEIYSLTRESRWKTLDGREQAGFSGRIIGGCMDTLCKLLGTRFAPVGAFIETYKKDGFIWALESCEMNAADIYRTLWQMQQCGWFVHCNGVLYGRADGYQDTQDFTLKDALDRVFGPLGIPVFYEADIGHIPPQMQIVNGALAEVSCKDGAASLTQHWG